MQKHSERTDKRPPIAGRAGQNNSAGNQSQNNNNNSNNNNNNNTNNNNNNNNQSSSSNNGSMNTTIPSMSSQEHPYWPKVSPDSAANITTDVLQHQQQQPPPPQHHEFTISSSQIVNSHEMHHHHSHHHHQRGDETTIEDLRHSGGGGGQTGLSLPPVSTPNGYDNQKLTSNSAFTPINAMPTHLNTLQHHQLSQRPYIYDAISFQNKNVAQNTGNGFPNQLISLHQIRNYAHQPGTLSGEHLIGVSVGKEKG